MITNWNHYNELEIVEALAAHESIIASEEELSESFDSMLSVELKHIYREGDEVMLNEDFSNYADSLCKEGKIHSIQYNEYCYVGQFA